LNIDQIISIMEEKEKGSTKVAELNYRIESLNSYIDILEKELAQEKKKNRENSLASLDASNCKLNASFVSNGANGRESEGPFTLPRVNEDFARRAGLNPSIGLLPLQNL
jgi:hypothetical protein